MRPVNHLVGLDNFVDSTMSSTRQCRRLDNVVDSTMSSTRQRTRRFAEGQAACWSALARASWPVGRLLKERGPALPPGHVLSRSADDASHTAGERACRPGLVGETN